jgi:dTMP kinase
MKISEGKFIVIYGINNIGKSTQAKLLKKYLDQNGVRSELIKYPVYSLEPAGKLINEYLRLGNPYNLTAREIQLIHYIDRVSFEPILKQKLQSGINIIAEDYFGTAIAWGTSTEVEPDLLEYLYKFIYHEDLAILLDGERFSQAAESNHRFENDKNLIEKTRLSLIEIAKKYGWHIVNGNRAIENVSAEIDKIVKKFLNI